MLGGRKGEGDAGESVEDGGEVELTAEESLNDGDVHHPDVVGEARDYGSLRPATEVSGREDGVRPFPLPSNPTDGAGGDLPAGATEDLGHEILAAETASEHGLDEAPPDVGETGDGGMELTVEPTVLDSGSACFSQLERVFGQMRKRRAASSRFQPRKFLISRMRKRCAGL